MRLAEIVAIRIGSGIAAPPTWTAKIVSPTATSHAQALWRALSSAPESLTNQNPKPTATGAEARWPMTETGRFVSRRMPRETLPSRAPVIAP